MTRGLVSPTYAATTSLKVARSAAGCCAAEADWPTYVTGVLGRNGGHRDGAWTDGSLSPHVSRLGIGRTPRKEPCEQDLCPRLDRPRPEGGGHGPGPRHGRGAEGRQRPPGHRHEPG